MKKTLSVIIALVLVLSLTACGQKPEAVATPDPNYTTYENAEKKISFSYPKNWTPMDATMLDQPEVMAEMVEKTKMDEATLKQSLAQCTAMFLNQDEADEKFCPNLNLVAADAPGVTQSMMAQEEVVTQIATEIETAYLQIFEAFNWAKKPEAKKIGGKNMIVMVTEYNVGEAELAVYQAMTAENDMMYTFTYSTHRTSLNDNEIVRIETILASVKFE